MYTFDTNLIHVKNMDTRSDYYYIKYMIIIYKYFLIDDLSKILCVLFLNLVYLPWTPKDLWP